MKFLHPEILYGLAAVIIPILVHLFNFRKFKKVAFSNVDFLKEVKLETKSKSKLKHLLVLMTRMLAITALVFAFAQPYIPLEDSAIADKESQVQIYIDNSFSMEAENENGNLLAIAKAKAEEIVSYYDPTDRFSLTTNDFEGRHQRWVNKDEIIDLIDDVRPSPVSRKLNEVLVRQADLNTAKNPLKSFVVSDLQRSVTSLQGVAPDSLRELVFVPTLNGQAENIFIDSAFFKTPVRLKGFPESLQLKIDHGGEQGLKDQSIKLLIDGAQKAIGSYALEPEMLTDTSLTYTVNNGGWHFGTVIIDDAPVSYDDELFFSYEVADFTSILEIHDKESEAAYFNRIFSDDDQFKLTSTTSSQVNYSELINYDFIILNQLGKLPSGLQTEVSKFVKSGGTVLLVPAAIGDLGNYNAFMRQLNGPSFQPKINQEQSAKDINLESYLYKGVFDKLPRNLDLPKVQAYYPLLEGSATKGDRLLSFQNGSPLLSLYMNDQGRLLVFSTSLAKQESNLTSHALFVASTLRIAETSKTSTQLYYTIGEDEAILLRNVSVGGDETLSIKPLLEGEEFIPEHQTIGGNTRLYIHNQVNVAGHYEVLKGKERLALVSFNYPRKESELAFYNAEEVLGLSKDAGISAKVLASGSEAIAQEVKLLNEGKTFWIRFIIMALIMLALEILLIKFWK